MSSSDFGNELSQLGLPGAIDPRTLALRALSQHRRRIRLLVVLTIGLWVLDFLIVPALWMPFARKLNDQSARLTHSTGTAELAGMVRDLMEHITMVSGLILAVMTLVSMLAAISTIWLVLTARRLTLEQLGMGLAQISEQLRRLDVK